MCAAGPFKFSCSSLANASCAGRALVQHAAKLLELQKIAFKSFQPALREFALLHLTAIETRGALEAHLGALSDAQLSELLTLLSLRSVATEHG